MIYPDYNEFNFLREKFNKITIYREIIADTITLINLLMKFQNKDSLFLLESVKTDKTFSRFGVCLGMQCITDKTMHGRVDRINILSEKFLFKNIPENFNAVRYHSLFVKIFQNSQVVTAISNPRIVFK